ncbi:MAG: TldD/PmbA family protein [Deltaproteobacteria bacterium]|nr:TldD/PmbA family protein [Deltaproteobacteria bacterium]
MKGAGLMDIARSAAQIARTVGAKDARAKVSRSREVRVEWRDGKLDRIRESTKRRLSVALYVDGRYSAGSTSDLRTEAVDEYVRAQVKSTRLLAEDEHRRLPAPARYEGMTKADLGMLDSSVAGIQPEDRLVAARDIEDAARQGEGSDRIVSVTSSVSDYSYTSVCVCTNGLEVTEDGTYLDKSAYVSVKDTDDRKPSGYSYGSTRFAADMPDAGTIGGEARMRALDQIGSKQADTGEYEVLIENRVVPTFARHLMRPLSGSAVQQQRSFLAEHLGKKVFSELLDIQDDPHHVRGLSSTPWDSEGMATKPRPVIEKGVLRTFYLDTYYASKLGMEPTTGSVTNLVWTPGKRDLEAMLAGVKKGILVTSFLGGNSNSTTGDFSLGITGFLLEKGKRVQPISEMNVAGNHLTFWKSLAEVGSDPWKHSSNMTPTLRFEAVQCSGS